MTIGSLMANGMGGYHGVLPPGSTISAITGTPPSALALAGPWEVARGTYDFGITTPTWLLDQARRGLGMFEEPLPLRAIAAFPHDDRLAFAVRAETGITSLRQIVEERRPLKISMPTRDQGHPAGWLLDEIFAQSGFSQDDIVSWGGEILRDRPRSQNSPDSIPVDPRFDAVFDEAIMTLRWKRLTTDYDLRFLPLDEDVLQWCEERGMPRGTIARGRFPGVEEDVPTVDFSGWVMYCAESLADDLVYLAVQALDEQKALMTARFQMSPTPPMTSAFDLTAALELGGIPLHPGAERYYREHGFLA
ncbi:TAXI family TRAP transporter solute-binding subunit [Microbacterium sp. 22242]|uniref:TAXI family TRAP transporter solute-binding subunit n=1 Tax=Microbacterium sp. 22242 TaxID=3453896 RepID=UPI003F82791E